MSKWAAGWQHAAAAAELSLLLAGLATACGRAALSMLAWVCTVQRCLQGGTAAVSCCATHPATAREASVTRLDSIPASSNTSRITGSHAAATHGQLTPPWPCHLPLLRLLLLLLCILLFLILLLSIMMPPLLLLLLLLLFILPLLLLLLLVILQAVCRRLPQPVCEGRHSHSKPPRGLPRLLPHTRWVAGVVCVCGWTVPYACVHVC